MEKMYIISESDLDSLKDHIIGASIDDFVEELDLETSDISYDENKKIQDLVNQVDILRKAYVTDIHLVQNKYQSMMKELLCELSKYK